MVDGPDESLGLESTMDRRYTASRQAKNDPWFRKTFSLTGPPVRATAYVASLGYHELYVNGKKVGDRVLAPSISDLTQRVRYVAYDVTDYLHEGKNAVVLWAAPGWADFGEFKVKDKPLVLAQIEILQSNGQSVQVVTDTTWKTHPSPLSPLGNWAVPGYGGEFYDAGREVHGWNTAELDDSAWKAAVVFSPNVRLSAEMVEPNRRIEILKPAEITSPAPGVFRIDMGRNYAGWFDIRMTGRPARKLRWNSPNGPARAKPMGRPASMCSAPRAKECSASDSTMPSHAGSRFAAWKRLLAPRISADTLSHRLPASQPV